VQSKNKKALTSAERVHVGMIKSMSCVVCEAPPPSEAHEPEQGLWFVSIPLCADCHRGSINGWHGQKAMWRLKKWQEIDALNETIKRFGDN
jgi:hypothetical protein